MSDFFEDVKKRMVAQIWRDQHPDVFDGLTDDEVIKCVNETNTHCSECGKEYKEKDTSIVQSLKV